MTLRVEDVHDDGTLHARVTRSVLALMEARRVNRKMLEERLCSRRWLYNRARGAVRWSIDDVARIAELFDVDAVDIVRGRQGWVDGRS